MWMSWLRVRENRGRVESRKLWRGFGERVRNCGSFRQPKRTSIFAGWRDNTNISPTPPLLLFTTTPTLIFEVRDVAHNPRGALRVAKASTQQ